MSDRIGRPNPHAYDARVQASARGVIANPDAPAGGPGRGQSRNARPRECDFWWTLGHWVHRSEEQVGSVIHKGEQFVHEAPDQLYRARDMYEAAVLAQSYLPVHLRTRIGVDVEELSVIFLPSLVTMMVILGNTAFLGTAIGAAVGAQVGSTGYLPGTILSGGIGLDAGSAVFDTMGLGFLLQGAASELPSIFEQTGRGIEAAWNAGHDPVTPPSHDIDLAARQLAAAASELIALLLIGLLDYLLCAERRQADPAQSPREFLDKSNAVLAACRKLAELFHQRPEQAKTQFKDRFSELENRLNRAGRWTGGLAHWLEKHFIVLVRDFEFWRPTPGVEGAGSKEPEDDAASASSSRKKDSAAAADSTPPKHWIAVRVEFEDGKLVETGLKKKLKLNNGETRMVALNPGTQAGGLYSTGKILDLTDDCHISFPDMYDAEIKPK